MADPDNTSFQDPIDWDALNDIVVGTHTFENVLYNPDELDSRAPHTTAPGKPVTVASRSISRIRSQRDSGDRKSR